MGKIDIKLSSNCRQCSICSIEQGVFGGIIRRSDPLALKYAPKGFCDIQMRTVWRQEKEVQSAFLPDWSEFSDTLASMNACVVKDNESILSDSHRQSVQIISHFVNGDILCGRESVKSVVSVNHAEYVESHAFLRGYKDIFTGELPSVWHISLSADMAFIAEIKVNVAFCGLLFEFLQLLGLIRIELRRGFPLGTFSYTSISRANADKKALNVLSLASLPVAFCQASLAFFTLCLSFSMAMRTASSSEQSMIGLRPRPGRVSSPLMPSVSKRFTHEPTVIWHISVSSPISSAFMPWDFKRTAWQRIRYAWLLPLRKPSSNCRRCWSVSCITLIFAIVVNVYEYNAQRYAKILI